MKKVFLLSLFYFAIVGCFGSSPGGGNNTDDPACQLKQLTEKKPGYPYDLQTYPQVLEVLTADCSGGACHDPGVRSFTVFPDAEQGNCNYNKTFNSFADFVDFNSAEQSVILLKVSAEAENHPLRYQAGDTKLDTLRGYVTDAVQTCQNDSCNTTTPGSAQSTFDYAVFQAQIQPILDNTGGGVGCSSTSTGCHGASGGVSGFVLNREPARDSTEMEDNFREVQEEVDFAGTDQRDIINKGSDNHAGFSFSAAEVQTIRDYLGKEYHLDNLPDVETAKKRVKANATSAP